MVRKTEDVNSKCHNVINFSSFLSPDGVVRLQVVAISHETLGLHCFSICTVRDTSNATARSLSSDSVRVTEASQKRRGSLMSLFQTSAPHEDHTTSPTDDKWRSPRPSIPGSIRGSRRGSLHRTEVLADDLSLLLVSVDSAEQATQWIQAISFVILQVKGPQFNSSCRLSNEINSVSAPSATSTDSF